MKNAVSCWRAVLHSLHGGMRMQRKSSTCLARLGLPHDRGVRDGGPAHGVLAGQAAQAGAVYVAVLHPLRACSNRMGHGRM